MVALLATAFQNANAAIRRVGYWGTPINNVDYTDLQSAHDAANTNDTLLIYPGSWYATYSKKLVTIGYGYFVDVATLGTAANANLQNITGALSIQVTLAAGCSNSQFEGLDGLSINGDGTGTTFNNIIIRRCKISALGFYQANTYNNWQVLQCWINYIQWSANAKATNLVVNNCNIGYMYAPDGSTGTPANFSGQFNNDIFEATPGSNNFFNGNFIVKNSIFWWGKSNDANCVYSYSIINNYYYGGTLPSNNGNQNLDYTTFNGLFAGQAGTTSTDGYYVLAAGSVAKNAGQGGTDCGIYGGTNPYKLSGIPRIPAIYKLTAPSNTTSGNPYTITLSVRSNN